MLWEQVARRMLFQIPAEKAHYLSMGAFSSLMSLPPARGLFRRGLGVVDERLNVDAFGLSFNNPVGLAAGFDKDARWFTKLADLGFSHVEVGTITGQPQPGNPQPRLFRLPVDKAIINRMGFNNAGADAAAKRLSKSPRMRGGNILGVNIGKTKVVPVEEATSDYLRSFERLFTYADYFTVNVSSPNTPGLRTLQNREPLIELLTAISQKNAELASDHQIAAKPILLKIAPDVTPGQLEDIVAIVQEVKLSGIIATNTTLSREGLTTSASKVESIGAGGLSGSPLTRRSRDTVAALYDSLGPEVAIIGVGGIMQPADAWNMICAGATLVQIYTGFIYGGPAIVRDMNRYLVSQVEKHGLATIGDARGRRDLCELGNR